MIHIQTLKYLQKESSSIIYLFYDEAYDVYYTAPSLSALWNKKHEYNYTRDVWEYEYTYISLFEFMSEDIIIEECKSPAKISIIIAIHNKLYKRTQKIKKLHDSL